MSSLAPDHALAYLRELSADFRAGVVLDARGNLLAGDPALAAPAARLLHAHPRARELHGTLDDRAHVFAAQDDERAIVVVTGPHALPSVARRDVRTALSRNAPKSSEGVPSERPERALIEAVVTAVGDAFRP